MKKMGSLVCLVLKFMLVEKNSYLIKEGNPKVNGTSSRLNPQVLDSSEALITTISLRSIG